jgi:hypothetical protein
MLLSNALGLVVVAMLTAWLALSLYWRVGRWNLHPAERLTLDEGLRVGSKAKEVACHAGESEHHLSFGGKFSLLVFGREDCEPCSEILRVAAQHPATRSMRLVYVSNVDVPVVDPSISVRWEFYRFHAEDAARKQWRAFVSPYFHVIDPDGMVVAKGVANKPGHLNRLLDVAPPATVRMPVDNIGGKVGG